MFIGLNQVSLLKMLCDRIEIDMLNLDIYNYVWNNFYQISNVYHGLRNSCHCVISGFFENYQNLLIFQTC